MSTFTKRDTYLSNKLYVPMIYNGTKFVPYFAYIIDELFTQFYTSEREAFITADGNKFVVLKDSNDGVE